MAAIGAGVLGLLCLSSSVCSAMSGGGGEETPAQITVVPDTETEAGSTPTRTSTGAAQSPPPAGIGTFGTDAVKGQYIRLWQGEPYQSQKAYALTILELEVYDSSGTNIAKDKTASSRSQYPGDHQPVLAFDGSLDTKYRSNYDVNEDWIEVDLGSVMDIHKIVIRHPGSEDVYEGVAMKDGLRGYIEIFDGNGTVGKTSQIEETSTDHVYTYNFKERGGGNWRGGQGVLKSRADIIAKKQASDAAAELANALADAEAKLAANADLVAKGEAVEAAAEKERLAEITRLLAAEEKRLKREASVRGKVERGHYANFKECWEEGVKGDDSDKTACCTMGGLGSRNNNLTPRQKRLDGPWWCMENTG